MYLVLCICRKAALLEKMELTNFGNRPLLNFTFNFALCLEGGCAPFRTFETFESLYLPHPIAAGPAGQVQARGIVVNLRQSPGWLFASNTLHRVRDHPQNKT